MELGVFGDGGVRKYRYYLYVGIFFLGFIDFTEKVFSLGIIFFVIIIYLLD